MLVKLNLKIILFTLRLVISSNEKIKWIWIKLIFKNMNMNNVWCSYINFIFTLCTYLRMSCVMRFVMCIVYYFYYLYEIIMLNMLCWFTISLILFLYYKDKHMEHVKDIFIPDSGTSNWNCYWTSCSSYAYIKWFTLVINKRSSIYL